MEEINRNQNLQVDGLMVKRVCLREPVPEIERAAKYLDEAVSAHLAGQLGSAATLIKQADMHEIRVWAESLYGKKSQYNWPFNIVERPPVSLEPLDMVRMPNSKLKRELHVRDGYHCRFCGIPLVRGEVRRQLMILYPNEVRWGRPDASRHTALYAMEAHYDHLVPHSLGGRTEIKNIVVTCAPCNYGRWRHTLDEMGLIDPTIRPIKRSAWDGLERVIRKQEQQY